MQHVYVHKDIGLYEEKIVGKLSARMLACIAAGIAAAVATGLSCRYGAGIAMQDASFPMIAASMPFWLAGFWKPKGMRPERFIPLYLRHAMSEGTITYTPGLALAQPATTIAATPDLSPRKLRSRLRKEGENHEPSAHAAAETYAGA